MKEKRQKKKYKNNETKEKKNGKEMKERDGDGGAAAMQEIANRFYFISLKFHMYLTKKMQK